MLKFMFLANQPVKNRHLHVKNPPQKKQNKNCSFHFHLSHFHYRTELRIIERTDCVVLQRFSGQRESALINIVFPLRTQTMGLIPALYCSSSCWFHFGDSD